MNPLSLTQTLARLLCSHPVRREDLSAYLDERLAPSERERVEEHLAACGRCRQELEELRAVVRALQGLSHVPVPRSFRLSPAQVEAAPVPARPTWAYGALGATTAAATILFAVLLGGDLLTLEGMEEAITPEGGLPAGVMSRQAEEAVEAGEGLPADAGLMAEGTPQPEPTIKATPPTSPPAREAPAEGFAPPMPTEPPEAEEAERAPAAEEGDGIGRIAFRVGEAAAAAVALATLGGLLVVWRRRAQT